MLSYRVFEKFARMLLEGQTATRQEEDVVLPTLFANVREEAFRLDEGDALRTSMAGLSMRMFTLWRMRLRVLDGGQAPTEDDLQRISFTEWADAIHCIYWRTPRIDHLHMECVAVTIAYCNMLLGSRALVHVQEMAPPRRFTPGRIDRGTVYAVMRATKTRELGRAFCRELLAWCVEQLAARAARIAARQDGGSQDGGSLDGNTPLPEDGRFTSEAERVNMYLLRLDLSEEEKE